MTDLTQARNVYNTLPPHLRPTYLSWLENENCDPRKHCLELSHVVTELANALVSAIAEQGNCIICQIGGINLERLPFIFKYVSALEELDDRFAQNYARLLQAQWERSHILTSAELRRIRTEAESDVLPMKHTPSAHCLQQMQGVLANRLPSQSTCLERRPAVLADYSNQHRQTVWQRFKDVLEQTGQVIRCYSRH